VQVAKTSVCVEALYMIRVVHDVAGATPRLWSTFHKRGLPGSSAQRDQRKDIHDQTSRNTPHFKIDKENAGRQIEMVDTSVVWGRQWSVTCLQGRARLPWLSWATRRFECTNLEHRHHTTFRNHAHGHRIHFEGELRCISGLLTYLERKHGERRRLVHLGHCARSSIHYTRSCATHKDRRIDTVSRRWLARRCANTTDKLQGGHSASHQGS
jgi:hypothetical protein